MVDNTRMKELTGDVKRILEMMENRNKEYAARFETLETTLEYITGYEQSPFSG